MAVSLLAPAPLIMRAYSRLILRFDRPAQDSCGDFAISEAFDEVIVHHSHCLNMGVYDSGPHEAESTTFQVIAKRIGLRRGAGNLVHNSPAVQFGLPADRAPRIRIKT